ncbi:MAG: CDP-glucose 4,6-dehydratase [Verrucomicrobiales bacterium]|nr:CDP-glucose 4,6-dehydratase [Verrucomicrobiales bacterium]|tara:strand:+ start:7600 stop:8676 length:1077 start_codon:yes stop_codon:yes gene_type:complete
MFGDYYRNRRVLVTGHTGFKGGWLSLWLQELGAIVHGVGLEPPTEPSLHEIIAPGTFASEAHCNIRNFEDVKAVIRKVKPDFVFHLAAQPLVRHSYEEPLETMATNVMGTAYVLESVRRLGLKTPVLVVTSDKCYANESDRQHSEEDALGGADVYSSSKAAAELVAHSWRRSFFNRNEKLALVATARAGNVIGGGDYAPDRIVPDAVRALQRGQPVPVRNPEAVRPWQHVLDCLSGYLWLGSRMETASPAYNFGPEPDSIQSVQQLMDEFLKHWPGEWENMAENNPPPEAARLTLSIALAKKELGWRPTWTWKTAVEQTAVWYRSRHQDHAEDVRAFSQEQIRLYCDGAEMAGNPWTK